MFRASRTSSVRRCVAMAQADHSAAPRIEHDGQVEEPCGSRDIRDVGDPELVGSVGREVPFDEIDCRASIRVPPGRPRPPTPPARTPDPFLLHQPAHPLLADHLARLLQLGVEPRPAVHLPVLVVGLPDLEHQLRVSLRPGRGRTAHPSVVDAGGESQHAAHRPNRIVGLIRLHELEPRSGIELLSRANQAAAFFRISCSMRSCLRVSPIFS